MSRAQEAQEPMAPDGSGQADTEGKGKDTDTDTYTRQEKDTEGEGKDTDTRQEKDSGTWAGAPHPQAPATDASMQRRLKNLRPQTDVSKAPATDASIQQRLKNLRPETDVSEAQLHERFRASKSHSTPLLPLFVKMAQSLGLRSVFATGSRHIWFWGQSTS